MTAISNSHIESVVAPSIPVSVEPSLTTPMLVSALGEHALAWLDNTVRFAVGALIAWGMLSLVPAADLSFLAAFSAATGWLYLANLADVERYKDAILFVVPTLFVWVVLALGANNAVLVGLTLFTHVFLSFVGAVARHSGTLRLLRLWSLLLGFQLMLLVYLIANFLI